jgi:hypothetical protein
MLFIRLGNRINRNCIEDKLEWLDLEITINVMLKLIHIMKR